MNESPTFAALARRYELRFSGLFDRGRGYAFPCDAKGRVDIADLSDQGRSNYLYALSVVGREMSAPFVVAAG